MIEAFPKADSSRERSALLLILVAHIAACCLSLIYVFGNYSYPEIFAFDRAQLYPALLNIIPLVICGAIFAFSRFSPGYLLGFTFYTMVLGYLWLAKFSLLQYDHSLGSISALFALLAFLAPALLVNSPIRRWGTLSETALDRVLSLILLLAAAIVGIGMLYNFRIVSIDDIYKFRLTLKFPVPLRYAIGIFSNALLPFAFACYFMLGKRWRAAATLLLLLLFYPITLTKLALFSPLWLLMLACLAEFFEARTAVILSIFLPLSLGIALASLAQNGLLSMDNVIEYFGPVNFRMIAIPSISLDLYSDYFSKHDLTYFCQITLLKPFTNCPYSDPLPYLLFKNYPFGFANASLFATEGVASVGLKWAPLSTFACGLVVAFANRLCAGLPPTFILLSAGVLVQVFVNVPMSTTLLSNGAAFLFALWYVTPREVFTKKP